MRKNTEKKIDVWRVERTDDIEEKCLSAFTSPVTEDHLVELADFGIAMPRKAKAMPLFDKPPLEKRLYECSQCEDEIYVAEWDARCLGWIYLDVVIEGHNYAVCPICKNRMT